jgi:hypothetical protein
MFVSSQFIITSVVIAISFKERCWCGLTSWNYFPKLYSFHLYQAERKKLYQNPHYENWLMSRIISSMIRHIFMH